MEPVKVSTLQQGFSFTYKDIPAVGIYATPIQLPANACILAILFNSVIPFVSSGIEIQLQDSAGNPLGNFTDGPLAFGSNSIGNTVVSNNGGASIFTPFVGGLIYINFIAGTPATAGVGAMYIQYTTFP
jgi:hypothetical protein